MDRPVPRSPAAREAALDAALAKAAPPTLPPGFAARIVAKATALPQLPPEPVLEPEVIEVARKTSADVIAFASISPETPAPRRRFAAMTGLATLAASVAAVFALGPAGNQTAAPVAGNRAAPMIASAPKAAPAPAAQPVAPQPRMAQIAPSAPVKARAVVDPPIEAEPESPAQAPVVIVPETQLATSGERPAAPVAGPHASPSPVVPSGGLMGPPAPQQAWSFGGGTGGPITLPGAKPPSAPGSGTMPPAPSGGGLGGGPPGHR